ncbi:hypothetical protein SJAG_05740 [Schizosaccharomyces japonicus yFS275]|uniref:Uncharacterized protein n=1 Tax=Schizosaccharomyces japonicus (strain yFS275 / FY16936) TaxID=402676 RepID=T0S0Z5_SCHJY|nr:hypothetical protein SJAG_05740 [Schizosaccharomyces japonicus yFS275]EQC52992.1 hypothetical protein SJAG_05740 [Schizosaccharomyces japonicus yFS275]
MRLKVSSDDFALRQWANTQLLGLDDAKNTIGDFCSALWKLNRGPQNWLIKCVYEGYSLPTTGKLELYLKDGCEVQLVRVLDDSERPHRSVETITTPLRSDDTSEFDDHLAARLEYSMVEC